MGYMLGHATYFLYFDDFLSKYAIKKEATLPYSGCRPTYSHRLQLFNRIP